MSKTMKTAVMTGLRTIEFEQREIPVPTASQVLVKIEYVGICGSDIHYYEDGRIGDFVVTGPLVLGHEASGTIVEVGAGVRHLKVGDVVALEPGIPCGICCNCRKGKYNLCPDVVFFATPPIDGVFCEYAAHPADFCFKLPANIGPKEGAMIEPLAIGFHAASAGSASVGQTTVVFGAGAIGLVSLMALKVHGVSKVIVIDSMEKRLSKALELGADNAINFAKSNPYDEIIKLTEGQGADLAIETSGAEAAANQAIAVCKSGGTIVMVGYSKTGMMNLNMSVAINKELRFETIFRYRHLYPAAIAAAASGKVKLDNFISHIFSFDDLPNAMEQSSKDKENITKAVVKIGK